MLQCCCGPAVALGGSLDGASQESASAAPSDALGSNNDHQMDGGATIDALGDDLLLKVLAYVGVPRAPACRTVLITSAAVKVREAHLFCRHNSEHVLFILRQDDHCFETTAELWRRSLAYTGLPEELLALPLWSRAAEADRLYDGLAAQRLCGAVSKRWRAVLGLDQVKVALCGVEDRPPESVEAVIVAWDWDSPVHAGDDALKYLADLPHLRVLVLWDSSQAVFKGTYPALASSALWPLPPQLRSLQHLAVLSTRLSCDADADDLVRSIADQRDLRTLVLPRLWRVSHRTFCDLVRKFPRLANLDTDGEWGLGLSDVTRLTDLRRLRIFAAIEGDPDLVKQKVALEHLVSNPLASLTSLESLELTGEPRPESSWRGFEDWRFPPSVLQDLSSLSSLTHLSFQDLTFGEASLQLIAAAPALQSLRFMHRTMKSVAPLAALAARLTSLHLMTRREELLPGCALDVGAVSALTALADLKLAGCKHPGDEQPFLLDAHTRLTRLELFECCLSPADGLAISRMSRLKRLVWIDVQGVTAVDDVLATLRSLGALESLTLRILNRGTRDMVARMPFSMLYPRLRELDLACSVEQQFSEALLPELSLMESLEVVRIYNGGLADGSDLARLRELRTLQLTGIHGDLEIFLASLCSCTKLCVVSISTWEICPETALPKLPYTLLWR